MKPLHHTKERPGGSVAGTGLLAIDDGVGNIFTADFEFIDIRTIFNFGFFNLDGTVNLMNFAYAGSNADLAGLVGSPDGVIQASFTAPAGQTLGTLQSGAMQVGNYSGTITGSGSSTTAPEPSAALCFGVGFLVVGAACRRWSRVANAR